MENLKEAATSKKFLTTIATAIGSIAATHLGIPVDQLVPILLPVLAYVIGQGIADIGKARAKAESNKDIKDEIKKIELEIELAEKKKKLADLEKQ